MLRNVNPYARQFLCARQLMRDNPFERYTIVLRTNGDNIANRSTYHLPAASDVAAIIPGSSDADFGEKVC